MKPLKDWTDQECSRWIAEKLEPLDSVYWDYWREQSPGWGWIRKVPAGGYATQPEPRDMINDAQMTVMLVTQLVQFFEVCIGKVAENPQHVYMELGSLHFLDDKPLGRATAEAWMLANGWEG